MHASRKGLCRLCGERGPCYKMSYKKLTLQVARRYRLMIFGSYSTSRPFNLHSLLHHLNLVVSSQTLSPSTAIEMLTRTSTFQCLLTLSYGFYVFAEWRDPRLRRPSVELLALTHLPNEQNSSLMYTCTWALRYLSYYKQNPSIMTG